MREMARARGLGFRVDPAVSAGLSFDPAPLLQRLPACEAVAIEMEDEALLEKAAAFHERSRAFPVEERLFACLAGVTSFHVDPRGTLLPCLMVPAGGYDLRSGSFRAGWEGVIARFREQGVPPGYECHACERRFLCGVCPAQSALETGRPEVKSEYNCRLGEARLAAVAGRRAPPRGEEPREPSA
jgi:radical SAM protein with 4Fe4S-binding SPASM domain